MKTKEEASLLCEQLAKALVDLGAVLEEQGKTEYAVSVYDKFVETVNRFGDDGSPSVRVLVPVVLIRKSDILREQGKGEEGIAVHDEIIRRFGNDDSPDVRKQVARAFNRKAMCLHIDGKTEEAIATYDGIIRLWGNDDSTDARRYVEEAKKSQEKLRDRNGGIV